MPSLDSPSRAAANRRGLIVLNVVLLIVLAGVTFGGRAADAQARVPGQYAMVAGGVNGAQSSAVYVADVRNRLLIGVTFDTNTRQLAPIGTANLGRDISTALNRRPGN